ncbi:DUF3857 domain-containing protein [Plebeiibacterium marinum]|uniref:DUF3857 domain-containing protein n=1 Tax=Plebeiibacterium marinum TaxID=2992111 RepID=A0AAE3SI58_9BACT|nr:DUF3857 domain-containing protein [Plebeiobacterium marinum]MCW3804054.1 DUF3857 domain-containing protein [Plebeiobacterium marinum]
MRKLFLTLIILTAIFITNAQTPPEENHDSGMRLTQCSFEPKAPAVVIFDKGKVSFVRNDAGFDIKYTRHKRVKIFKESAFDQGEVEIPLYIGESEMETVKDISATTYYFNGSTLEQTQLDQEQIFKEPVNKHWYMKKFAMPDLKEGCIIDYSYTVYSPFLFNLPDWEFQNDLPTIYSEYKTYMIPFYSYTYRAQGFSSFDVYESQESKGMERQFMNLSFKDLEYTFGMKNIPSFTDESFISSRSDYVKKIDFQLSEINYPSGYSQKVLTTWPALAKDFMDHEWFGKYIKKSEKLGSKNFSSLAGKTDMEKIEAVVQHMKLNYKHNGRNDKWALKSIKEFTSQKTGNSANINLMALGILKSQGVNCRPVIISTRDHGKVYNDFPFADVFNDVLILATVDNETMLIDATDPYCPTNIIPANCCNGKGFVVDEEKEQWVNIYNTSPSKNSTILVYNFNPEQAILEGKATVNATGHIAIDKRKSFTKDEEKFVNSIKAEGLDLEGEIAITSNETDQNFNFEFDFTSHVDQIEDQYIFSPFIKFPIKENPFKQNKRDYSIDFVYPSFKLYQAHINVPEGYEIEKMPDLFSKVTKNASFEFKAIKQNSNTIVISGNYLIKKAIYPAEAYRDLKIFYKNLTEKLNQSIVIRKEEQI